MTLFCFFEKCLANEGDLHISFMLAKYFVISLCCVVTYPNITSEASTITRYKNMQEITAGYVKKLRPN